jgi:hypothetical protein
MSDDDKRMLDLRLSNEAFEMTPQNVHAWVASRDGNPQMLEALAHQPDFHTAAPLADEHVEITPNFVFAWVACRDYDEALLRALIQQPDFDKNQALIVECQCATQPLGINLLLEAGADVHFIDGNGDAPLTAALDYRNLVSLPLILNAKANIRQVDGKGRVPLQMFWDPAYQPDAPYPDSITACFPPPGHSFH